MLMTTEFGLQLDEYTLPGNELLLLAYVRFIKGGLLCQELLFASLLETDTKGESVYQAVVDYFQNLGCHEFCQFTCLSGLEKKTGVKDDDIAVYCAHLVELHRDMSVRFNNLFSLEIPGWVIDPFTEPSTEVPTHLKEELVSLQNHEDLKPKFKTFYQAFWMQTAIPKCYPTLWKDIKLFFIAFLTSYLVERRFSTVSRLLTKQRNKLNITERGDLRLLLMLTVWLQCTKPTHLIKQGSC